MTRPSIPLPWTLRDARVENPYWHMTALYAGERLVAHLQCTNGPVPMIDGPQTARYVLHAVNEYPRLVAALRLVARSRRFKGGTSTKELQRIAHAALAVADELGDKEPTT